MKWMYIDEPKIIKSITKDHSVNTIVNIVQPDDWKIIDGMRFFKEINRSYFISPQDINNKPLNLEDCIAVWISNSITDDSIKNFAKKNGYKNIDLIKNNHQSKLYLLKR